MPEESGNTKTARTYHTVLPEVETLLTIQAEPNAICSLYHDKSEAQALQLDADDNGVVRIHVRARKDWQPIDVRLEYTDGDGNRVRHTLVLRGDANHDGAVSPNEAGPAKNVGSVRPALEGDPMALSNRELIERGYPPRPDASRFPARYARWHELVSRPFTAVSPRLVPHPEVSFGLPERFAPTLPLPPPVMRPMFNANWSTWSGAYLTNPVKQFCAIYGSWNVPGVIALPNAPFYSAAAQWVGLDNSATDLYQSGSDSECYYMPAFGWTFTNYWMWIENLPFAPWAIPNFPLSPGDSVSVDIFAADQFGTTWFKDGANGGLTGADNNIWFMVYNHSKRLSYWGTLPTGSQTIGDLRSSPFTGSTAEFIVERPSLNGSPVPLASFIMTVMHSCGYADSNYGDMVWPLGADGSSPFDGELTYLNMQNPATKRLLDFTLSVPDSKQPSASAILWLWTGYS